MGKSKYNPAALRGLARPHMTLSAWHDVFESSVPELGDDLREIHARLLPILYMTDTRRIAVSLACSIVNMQYLEHGMECACDDNGNFGFTFEPSLEERQVKWHGLINLDQYPVDEDAVVSE